MGSVESSQSVVISFSISDVGERAVIGHRRRHFGQGVRNSEGETFGEPPLNGDLQRVIGRVPIEREIGDIAITREGSQEVLWESELAAELDSRGLMGRRQTRLGRR